ncbi:MAG: hypothetical protein ACQES2_02045 [Pseudomonadota bacterium]
MSTLTGQNIHRRLTFALQGVLILEVVLAVVGQQWLTAVIASGIVVISLAPFFIGRFFRVFIPPEIVLLIIGFVFASLFLGEIHDYYARFWWWDIALHSSSGVLLGFIGFLLVHVLNETEDIGMHMKPGFVAFFAFLFAVGTGAVWEIFEFSMDQLLGMNMQKPMLGDDSGLTDTMWDLIVASVGAVAISVAGYGYLKSGRKGSLMERWIHAFVESNPKLFKRRGR